MIPRNSVFQTQQHGYTYELKEIMKACTRPHRFKPERKKKKPRIQALRKENGHGVPFLNKKLL